jgi:hypothetical protein
MEDRPVVRGHGLRKLFHLGGDGAFALDEFVRNHAVVVSFAREARSRRTFSNPASSSRCGWVA